MANDQGLGTTISYLPPWIHVACPSFDAKELHVCIIKNWEDTNLFGVGIDVL